MHAAYAITLQLSKGQRAFELLQVRVNLKKSPDLQCHDRNCHKSPVLHT